VWSCKPRLWTTSSMADTSHELYEVWSSMLKRCDNPSCASFKDYGGRGISVCPEWYDFNTFLNDVGLRPEGRLPSGRPMFTLDRVDNDGNYEPGNVRWATPEQQANNRRLPDVGDNCPQGHPRSEFRYTLKDGRRRCRECDRIRIIEFRDARRGGRPAGIPPGKRTHCPAGHPYDDVNTYVSKTGKRHCRTCQRESMRKRREAKREKVRRDRSPESRA
jgi:hypothetical protein